jgi:hypothetical protein
VPVAALLGGLFGLVPIAAMGLSVPFLIVGPLALLTGALYSGLAAAGAGSLLAPDRSRSHLAAVLLFSGVGALAAAVAGAAVLLVPPWSPAFPRPSGDATVGEAIVVCVSIVVVFASGATWLFRQAPGQGRHHRGLHNDAAVAWALAGLCPLIVIGTIYVGCGVTTYGP